MRIWIWLVLALAALLVVGWMLHREGPRWTTDSPEALAQLEQALDAEMKLYHQEAQQHLERALELDSDFVAAHLLLSRGFGSEHRERSLAALRQAEVGQRTNRLTPRERFMVQYRLTMEDKEDAEAYELLERYLGDHPDDPFAIDILCGRLWAKERWDEAESCYNRILASDPNWVQAQNRLGYIALAQGRFRQAEDLFEAYRFIAPDQANPHDSMGELLTLIGRYDDAEVSLRQALEVRPDFCASYEHLIRLYDLQGRFDDAWTTLEEMRREPSCSQLEGPIRHFECSIGLWERVASRDWQGAWKQVEEGCTELQADAIVLAHVAAVKTGHLDAAKELEGKFEKRLGNASSEKGADELQALVAHMVGVRAVGDGDFREAASRFLEADRKLRYWDDTGLGIFKLYNQATLAEALQRLGESAEAREVVGRISSVNPPFAQEVEEDLSRRSAGAS